MKWILSLLTLLVILAIFFGTRQSIKTSEESRTDANLETKTGTGIASSAEPTTGTNRNAPPHFDPGTTTSNPSAEDIEEQIETLAEASTKSDAQSFQLIVDSLGNADPKIREAAREAAIQFGSVDAIPFLKGLAAKTDDPREKVEILDAIEFLELPPFSEVRALRTNSTPRPVPK